MTRPIPRDELVALIPRLRRYARVLARDAASADDLVQEALARACEHWARFRPGSDLRAWVFTIMHNVQASRWARQRLEPVAAPAPEPRFDPAGAQGEAIDVERALARLSPEAREVLALVCLEEFTYAEAAEALGVPIGTVMSRLSRARERLRALLDGEAPAAAPTLRRVT